MLNTCFIMGRLTRNPELHRTQSGTPVCSFTVAVDRDYQSKDSAERQADFIGCVAWRGTAEFICKHFGKGRMIVVDGSLQSRRWVDNDGTNRHTLEVVVGSVYFAGECENAAQATTPALPPAEDDGNLPF